MIEHLPTVDSTNAELVRRLEAGQSLDHGFALLSDAQTAGRGRLGRIWQSPPGQNLLMSIVLRTPVPASRVGLVPLATGVAMAVAAGADTVLKWPNDLLAPDGRKVGGVLAQREAQGRWMVVGIGLNVGWAPPGLPATCLASLGEGRSVAALALQLRSSVLTEIERLAADPGAVLARWRQRAHTLGRRVSVSGVAGLAVDIDSDGALKVRTDAGEERRILAGDVSMVGVRGPS